MNCQRQTQAVEGNEVFVSGIPKSVTMQELMEYFGAFGPIQDARIFTGKNMALVKYKTAAGAKNVLRQAEEEGIFFGWRELMVEKATSKHFGVFSTSTSSKARSSAFGVAPSKSAVLVRNVPRFCLKLDEHAFWRRFSRFGTISSTSYIENGVAYVEYLSSSSATLAAAGLHGVFNITIVEVRQPAVKVGPAAAAVAVEFPVKGSRVESLIVEKAAQIGGPSA